jgi:dephospho-CoA kinase
MNKRIIKIAFYGKMGAGKTTASLAASGALADKFGQEDSIGYVIKFAQPLYNCLQAFHRTVKEAPERTFMQRTGDLARREFGDNIMERIFRENVEGLITNKLPTLAQSNVLIMTDDLRFLGEYKLLKEMGFCIIQIEADEETRKERLGSSFTNIRHRSEMEQEQFIPDFVIENNQTLDYMTALENKIKFLADNQSLFGDEPCQV